MRIALYHNLPSGGAKRVAYEHSRRLRARGHEVVAYELQIADTSFCDLAPVVDTVVKLPLVWREIEVGGGLAALPRAVWNTRLMRDSFCRLARIQAALAQQIAQDGFDLLYVHNCGLEVAPSLLRYAATPTVYFCQEPGRQLLEAAVETDRPPGLGRLPAEKLWRQSWGRHPLNSYIHAFQRANERVNTQAADRVLANSLYSMESILRAHGRPARWCRLGVDTDFLTPGGAERGSFVLSVGGFHVTKGFRFLIRALGAVPPSLRPPLVLIGDRSSPGEKDLLRRLAEQCQVALTLKERVSDEELRELYRTARLFLYAPYLEPLGLTPLEAMACGTPVLGVREGGVRETVLEGVNGRLVERDESQFAAALAEMLADPGQLEEWGRQGHELVARDWTWDRSVDHLLQHFEEVAASTP